MRRACRATTALLDGVWLGYLSRALLQQLNEAHYDEDSDFLEGEARLRGLLDWEQAALREYFPASGTIAIVGAGGGREVLALIAAGYDAHGFECNRRLVSAAERVFETKGLSSRVQLLPCDMWPVKIRMYDGAILGWGAYTHIRGTATRIRMLRQARSQLTTGAPVLVSFFYRLADTSYYRIVTRVANALRRLTGAEKVEMGDALIPLYVHYFTREQIEDELRAGGFEPVAYEVTNTEGYAMAVGLAV